MRLVSTVLLTALCTTASLAPAASSSFTAGDEGWTIADLPGNATAYTPLLGTFPVAYDSAGGFISATDPTNNTIFLSAPAAYLGNQSAAAGGTLTFDLRTTHDTWTLDTVVVLVGANGTVLVNPVAQPPANVWSSYSVAISPGGWRVTNPAGPLATAADLAGVLSNVSMLALPAEFGNGLVETTSLDNVGLNVIPEPMSLGAIAAIGLMMRRHRF